MQWLSMIYCYLLIYNCIFIIHPMRYSDAWEISPSSTKKEHSRAYYEYCSVAMVSRTTRIRSIILSVFDVIVVLHPFQFILIQNIYIPYQFMLGRCYGFCRGTYHMAWPFVFDFNPYVLIDQFSCLGISRKVHKLYS